MVGCGSYPDLHGTRPSHRRDAGWRAWGGSRPCHVAWAASKGGVVYYRVNAYACIMLI